MGHLSKAWVVACLVLAACEDDPRVVSQLDAGPEIDAAMCPLYHGLCNPLGYPGQQGCNPGQKCTFVVPRYGDLLCPIFGCVPEGSLGEGEACERPPTGTHEGDDCETGLICADGRCRDICGFDGSAASLCAPGFNCTRHDDLFVLTPGSEPNYGACHPGCDPITQLGTDGAPCPAGEGCYVLTTQTETVAVCAEAGTVAVGETIVGPAFANSCVPGASPRRRDPDSMELECGGLCRPADVTSTTNQASEAGVAPDDCTTRWGAAPPDDPQAGESCRYWWAREPFEGLSAHSNRLGWCFEHASFRYDADLDGTDEAPFPRCTELTTGDVVPPIGNPMHNDAQYFWCTALPATFARTRASMTTAAAPQQITRGLVAPVVEAPVQLDRLRR